MDLVQYFSWVNQYLISSFSKLTISPRCCADFAKQCMINSLLFQFLCFKNTVICLHLTISVSLSMVSEMFVIWWGKRVPQMSKYVLWHSFLNSLLHSHTQLHRKSWTGLNITHSLPSHNSWWAWRIGKLLRVSKLTEKLPSAFYEILECTRDSPAIPFTFPVH